MMTAHPFAFLSFQHSPNGVNEPLKNCEVIGDDLRNTRHLRFITPI